MSNHDLLQRFTFQSASARGQIITLNDSYQQIVARGEYPEPVALLLGELTVAAALFASSLKQEALITVQAKGTGALRSVMAECDQNFHVRGIALGDFEQINAGHSLQELLVDGALAITITPQKGQRYQGIVPLEKPDLAGCLEDYFLQSEQLPTKLQLATDNGLAAGLIIQQLPGDRSVEEQEEWEELCQLLATLSNEEQLQLSHNDQLYRLFHQHQVTLLQSNEISFGCSCSRQRTEQALLALGSDELHKLSTEQPLTLIHCQFCNQEYRFTAKDLLALGSGDTQTLH